MKAITIGMVLAILLAPAVLAINYDHECMDGNLVRSANITIDGSLVEINQTIACEWGCDDVYDQCVWPPAQRYTAILVIILVLFCVIWWIGKKRG